jgi:hypothetical protein
MNRIFTAEHLFTAKAWLGGVGIVVGLAGVVLAARGLVWVAVGFLGIAFLLRFVPQAPDA